MYNNHIFQKKLIHMDKSVQSKKNLLLDEMHTKSMIFFETFYQRQQFTKLQV